MKKIIKNLPELRWKDVAKSAVLSLLVILSFLHIKHELRRHGHFSCPERYYLVNPIFACFEKNTINKKDYIDLKLRLTSYIDKEIKDGRAYDIGLFFRDLEAGPTLGINDRKDFVPASLLKLPNALALMRLSEEEFPELLSNKIVYNTKSKVLNINQNFPPPEIIQSGVPYTVEELMERSLKFSDNLATEALLRHLEKIGEGYDFVGEVYRDLGILNNYNMNSSSIGVKSYASIFRLLYNSSFLNSDNSEKLLEVMLENPFIYGLRKGVPDGIKISHKFGERDIVATGEKHLHDCGIIYYPGNPYLLCIMTKGKDFDELSKIIGKISEEVYKEFDSRRID